jgi:hypothetical protein
MLGGSSKPANILDPQHRLSIRFRLGQCVICFNNRLPSDPFPSGWWGNLRERDYWGDPGVDGRIILRWIFRKWDVGVWT